MIVGQPDRHDPGDWRWMGTDVGGTVVTLLRLRLIYFSRRGFINKK